MEPVLKSGPDKVLERTLEDLQVRSKVEATLQSLLVDVEVAASLKKELEVESELTDLKRQVSQYENALSETQAVQSQQRLEQSCLADSLVQELWTLSQELGQLRRWKETHETTISQHDEVVAKLLQAEEEIRLLKSTSASRRTTGEKDEQASGTVRPTSVPEPGTSTIAMIPDESIVQNMLVLQPPDSDRPSLVEPKSVAAVPLPNGMNKNQESGMDAVEEDFDDLLAEDRKQKGESQSDQLTSDSAPTMGPQQADPDGTGEGNNIAAISDENEDDNAVVALLQDVQGDVPTLDTLNMKILANIFEFLDALEILNTAQINITMFSRVDALFGLGGAQEGGADDEAPTEIIVQQEPSQPPTVVSAPSSALPLSDPSSTRPSPATTTAPPPPQKAVDTYSEPTVKMPQPSSTVTTTSNAAAPRRGGIFSLLQARGGVAPGRRNVAGSSDQPLSAAMTDSMVAKLTDKELGAIFSLTEKLHQREKAVAALTAEKEELVGKLEGTEALKGFLINKVRDIERSLRKSQEDEMKVAQQISSDQEVIAFLDSRVQELERDIKSLSDEKKRIGDEMSRRQSQNDKKTEVLGDMLQFERERVSENEREWKATKKLLVKEIKSCRAQLLALQAERDGFREQNERLRKAVLLTNPSIGGSL